MSTQMNVKYHNTAIIIEQLWKLFGIVYQQWKLHNRVNSFAVAKLTLRETQLS